MRLKKRKIEKFICVCVCVHVKAGYHIWSCSGALGQLQRKQVCVCVSSD